MDRGDWGALDGGAGGDGGGTADAGNADGGEGLADADGDGYTAGVDCDDGDADVHPGADEVCNDIDDDCDGLVDDADNSVDARVGGFAWYVDTDGDGDGLAGTGTWRCMGGDGLSRNTKDCDDSNADVHVGAIEICNDIDDDCDDVIDGGLRVPTDYDTIGDAMAAAVDGDLVCVAPGTYAESLDFDNLTIEVQGAAGPDRTMLTGDGSGPIVLFPSPEFESAILSGFTISGGDATGGAAVRVVEAKATLRDVVVSGNACSSGTDCAGVGVYCENGDLWLDDVFITGNVASGAAADLSIAQHWGVGVYLDGCDASFQDVSITDNSSEAPATANGVATGVGLYATRSRLEWTGGTLSSNWTSDTVKHGVGGGAYLDSYEAVLHNVVVSSNLVTGSTTARGGGVYTRWRNKLSATNVIFSGNRAESDGYDAHGAALAASQADVELNNCDFVGNNVAQGDSRSGGGAISLTGSGSEFTMTNCNVVDNEADAGGAIYNAASSFDPIIRWSNFDSNGSDAFSGMDSPVGSEGNIAVDPAYADTSSDDPSEWDLSLKSHSSCIDAGDPSILDADGSTSDIGAYGGPGAADW